MLDNLDKPLSALKEKFGLTREDWGRLGLQK
jgi:hypothetical protein